MSKVQVDNMKLWNQVCETDPATTKHVAQRGGFTAICAQSQRKRATEMWGPYGQFWVLKDLSWSMVRAGETQEIVELVLHARFVFPGGEFEIASDIKYKPGDDCRKKLMTDVTTKALSILGFNADVFEGKFDDNKYVERASSRATAKKFIQQWVDVINASKTLDSLEVSLESARDAHLTDAQMNKVEAAYHQHKTELEAAAML